jgi:hypothetical protein
LFYSNNVHIFEPMKRLEFYETYCKIKQPDGSFVKPVIRDFDRWLLNGLDNGKTLKIVKGRSTKIVLV